MTFCHPEKDSSGHTCFKLNYLRWGEIGTMITRRCSTDHVEKIKTYYRKLMEAENLLGQISNPKHLKVALEYCGFYPEREG